MNKLQKIINQKGDANFQRKLNLQRQSRLKALIDKHGEENVSAASDLSVSSIRQYLRTKNPIIGENAIAQAENILEHL